MKTINYKGDEYPYGSPTYENLSKLKVGQKFVSNNRCYPQEKDIAHYFENGTVHGFKPDIDPKIMEDYKLVGRANGCWTSSRQLGKIVMEGYEHQQDKSNQYMLIREKVSDSNLAAYCKANSADSLCQVKEPTEPVEESLEPTVSVVPVEPINCQDNPDDPMCASAKANRL